MVMIMLVWMMIVGDVQLTYYYYYYTTIYMHHYDFIFGLTNIAAIIIFMFISIVSRCTTRFSIITKLLLE